nr:MSMEG_1061 family FMN-dependent PPOX-type flavoprotein [uncultured Noviherbaspirillum sp.]
MHPELMMDDRISDVDALEQLFGKPVHTARQESDHIHAGFRAFIEEAPFIILASCGADGLDASAKGDAGGFVRVIDEKTLLIPERGGNGRNDSLRNIIGNPQVALTFFIPGRAELLRVSGQATLSVAPHLLAKYTKPPRCVILVRVDEVFSQCSRAVQQSHLWSPAMPLHRLPGSVDEA